MGIDGGRAGVFGVAAFLAAAAVFAQPSAPLPGGLAGDYRGNPGRGGKIAVLPLELAQIVAEGENVTGVVSAYRSPAGNCVADNTPFRGTYRDGTLSLKSERLKSQFADGRPCGGIAVEVKLEGGRASGVLKVGSESFQLELEAK